MTDTTIRFEGGEVLANLDERTITGLLIPYGEVGSTNVGRFQVEAGAVALPADPSVVGLNTDHERSAGVGRATRLWEEPAGIMATFQVARTPEGDQALADAISPTGRRRRLSGEFGPAVVEAGRLVAGKARLWGAALVERGAFPSAQVLAELAPDELADVDDAATTPDEIAVETSSTLPDSVTVTTTTGETAIYTPEAPAEDDTTEEETNVSATATPAAPVAATPQVLATAGAPAAIVTPTLADPRTHLRQVFAALNAVRQNRSDAAAMHALAALVDVKVSGAGALPAAGVLQPNWVGQLNQGVPYEREYITLGKLGTDISIEGKKGFKVKRGTAGAPLDEFDGTWAGNKAAVPSYPGYTQTAASTRRNWALANDIAREFYDLPGGAEVVEALLSLWVEDYHRQSDEWALTDWITAAGAPVTPETAKYSTEYPEALGMVLQGILAVKRRKADGRRDVPTFAIVNEAGFEELVYAAGGAENLPAFVSISISTASRGQVDGNVQIVQGATGIEDTASAIVGADYAIEFDEIPGGPVQIDALDIARGGIDKAMHAYLQTFVVRPEAVVLVGDADA